MTALDTNNHSLYIGGQWVDSAAGESYAIRNPAHIDQVLGTVQTATVEDSEKAVSAAADAAAAWAATPAPQRGPSSTESMS